jgi:AraC-like DNA-binding protein
MNKISANNITENLRAHSLEWDSDFIEGNGTSQVILNGEIGEGTVTSYTISPELGCLVYDATFFKEIRFEKDEAQMNPVYFLYCLEGYYYHKFSEEDDVKKLSRLQNVIIASGKNTRNIVVLPANVKLKMTVIFVLKNKLDKNENTNRELLISSLKYVIKLINSDNKYKYFGSIDIKASRFAEILIDNKRKDAIGRLTAEAAALNLLKAQIETFAESSSDENVKLPLTEKEMDIVVNMVSYISSRFTEKITIQQLYEYTGLSPQKLQLGTKFLYGESLNNFIRSIRLEYAKDLLSNTNKNISEVLYEVGFSSRGYFSKIFKERFGVLPHEFSNYLNSESTNFELSYKSDFEKNTNSTDIENIINTATVKNKKLNVTGCLIVYKKSFFQILEGPKNNVLEIYESIKKDKRHKNVQLIWKGSKINRLFEDWAMALISEKGNLNVKLNGELRFINIKELLNNQEEETIAMEILWRRVRNILKAS